MASAPHGTMRLPDKHSANDWHALHSQLSDSGNWASLQEHQKPFQCGLCNVTFDINVELVSHVHNHSLTKPYQCGYCKVSYDSNPQLIIHVKTHAMFMLHASSNSLGGPIPEQVPVSFSDKDFSQPNLFSACSLDKPQQSACIESSPFFKAESEDINKGDTVDPDATDDTAEPDAADGPVDTDSSSAHLLTDSNRVVNIGSEMGLELETPWQCKKAIKSEIVADGETEQADPQVAVKTEHEMEIESLFEQSQSDSKDYGSKGRRTSRSSSRSKLTRAARKIRNESTMDMKTVNNSDAANSKGFECSVCGKVLKREHSLKRHVVFVHSDNRPFPCTQCPLRFKAKNHLKTHISFVHNEERPFSCSQCSAKLKNKVQLAIHIQRKHSHKPPNQLKPKRNVSVHSSKKDRDVSAVSLVEEKPYVCSNCPGRFKKKWQLAIHIARVHENQRPFPCPVCAARFKSKSELNLHTNRMHSTETPHQCADCGKCFRVKEALAQHFCKPRECPICQCLLNFKNSYNSHMIRKHPKERPFQCNSCQKAFGTETELKAHTRTHEKPFVCEFCGQSFGMRTYLTYHHNSHHLHSKPYKCNICQKGFNFHSGLSQHKRRHIGDRRYLCTQCDKRFYNSDSLKRHSLTHTELRSFACTQCGKTYRCRSSLKYHLKHSHPLPL